MYKEIQTIYYDSFKGGYKEGSKRIIRIKDIRQIFPENSPDESFSGFRVQISDDHIEDILVSQEEGESIKKILLSNGSKQDDLAKEIASLTNAIRDLWALLRARM